MDRGWRKARKAVQLNGVQFSASESFGLFMEGLRSMKEYTQEGEKDAPDPIALKCHLDDALDCLGRCEAFYPKDILPLYSLGLALTMKNQNLYAQMLMKYGVEVERLPRLAPRRTSTVLRLAPAQGGGATGEPIKEKTRTVSRKKRAAATFFVETVYLPPPPRRAWPLLSHAKELFEKVMTEGQPELHAPAMFNLAHVYSKRDSEGDLGRAEELLNRIRRPSSPATWEEPPAHGVRSMPRGKGADETTESRKAQEALVIWLQAQTLLASVTARQQLTEISHTKDGISPGLATIAVSTAKKQIDTAKVSASIKTDLEADCWTKAGFIAYEQAFVLSPADAPMEFDARLDEAEEYLRRALQLKENWNPAQIYLAQVLQAQGRVEEAAECLEAVVGKPPAQPVAQGASPQGKSQAQTPQSEPEQPKQ